VRDLLFPIGPRQAAELRKLAAHRPVEVTFQAVHAGVAMALQAYTRRLAPSPAVAAWLRLADSPAAAGVLSEPTGDSELSERIAAEFAIRAEAGGLGQAYAAVLSPDLRHRLGEHYTPDWLVTAIARRFAGTGVVADPACGDGRFLVALLDAGHPADALWAADINPLAVAMARITVWVRLGRPAVVPPVPVRCADFVLDPSPPADAFVGNPPWVTWRNLSDGYRRTVAARMEGTRLHHTRGWSARVAAGQTDLAHVFVHEAAERVAPGGRIGFVLPRSVFKAPVGPGPIRSGVATSGRRYAFDEVWDCVGADPFTGVRLSSVVAFATADRSTSYPVPWRAVTPESADRPGDGTEEGAVPSDPADPGSAWLSGAVPLRLASGARWRLRARGGVNTGGGNSAFYVDVLARAGGLLTIRNVPARRARIEVVTADLEPDYVRPLVRGRDVTPFRVRPSGAVVLPHRAEDLRRPVPEAELAATVPLTYAYLCRFRTLLAGRRELARWPSQAWYQLFRIGPYTAACYRVVWPTSANGQLKAAVLDRDDPAVPDQKVVLVPFDALEPALFLTALLNAAPVRAAAAGSAGLDASPNLMARLPLPEYDARRHRRIVELAGTLHSAAATAHAGDEVTVESAVRSELDAEVTALFR